MPGPNPAIYLDYGATTPVDPRVLEEMLPHFCDRFGNPGSRMYGRGQDAESAVSDARDHTVSLLGARPPEITYTAGATESNNLALKGIAAGWGNDCTLITSATEHPSVMQTARYLGSIGVELIILPVQSDGRVDPEELRSHLGGDRVLVSIMHANNETGVVNPIAEIAAVCYDEGAVFHCDASQSAGKLPIDLEETPIDLLSISAHKFYGPKGVGALYVRRRNPATRVEILVHGGNQERGLRSGTLNVPGIVGMGCASRIAEEELESEAERQKRVRDQVFETFESDVGGVSMNGCSVNRLPGHLNVSFDGVGAEHLQYFVKDRVELSAGSACSTGSQGPSASITALGISGDRAYGAIRLVFGRFTTEEHARTAASVVGSAVLEIRSQS
jgi:cysteine desulfurase